MDNLEKYAKEALKDIGIEKGHIVFDCCCGSGTYTIPVAELVGEEGLVYAMDINSSKLRDLEQKINERKLKNIRIIERDVERNIFLPENSVDIVFLFDIFWYFRPTYGNLTNLIKEIYRITRQNALIFVYPKHISTDELDYFKNEMISINFRLEKEYSRILVHEESLDRSTLLNFKKQK
jgi:ubiquinone/menaquinone biosynthesis C-methylase UbiE